MFRILSALLLILFFGTAPAQTADIELFQEGEFYPYVGGYDTFDPPQLPFFADVCDAPENERWGARATALAWAWVSTHEDREVLQRALELSVWVLFHSGGTTPEQWGCDSEDLPACLGPLEIRDLLKLQLQFAASEGCY